jgi:hypothetical protein
MNILIEKAKSGMDNLVLEINGMKHPVYSRYDPEKDGERFYRENITSGSDFFIIIGIGLGYHIKPFTENNSVKKIVVIEPFEEIYNKITGLKSVLEVVSSNKVEFLCGEDVLQFIGSLTGRYDYLFYNKLQVLCYPPLKRASGSKYQDIEKAVENGVDTLVEDSVTIGKFARVWLRNFIINYSNVKKIRLISSLFGTAKGTAVVTGAGPSLDRALPNIKVSRRSIFLIATDASVKPLIRNGVKPDLIVTIDPQAYVRCHFEGLDRGYIEEIPAVLNLLSFPSVVDIFNNKYFFFSKHPTTSLFDTIFLKKQKAIINYQSVSSLAYKIAVEMGFGEIYLAGFDFSYPGLRAYAGKTFFYDFAINRWERLKPIQTVECKMILRGSEKIESPGKDLFYTSQNLLSYHRELLNAIDEARSSKKVVTRNWKASGIPIKGVENTEEALFSTVPTIADNRDILMEAPFKLPAASQSDVYNFKSKKGAVLNSLAVTLALRNRIYKGVSLSDEAFELSDRYISDKFLNNEKVR